MHDYKNPYVQEIANIITSTRQAILNSGDKTNYQNSFSIEGIPSKTGYSNSYSEISNNSYATDKQKFGKKPEYVDEENSYSFFSKGAKVKSPDI